MARPNYQFKKRQKELARKKKKELKRLRKQSKSDAKAESKLQEVGIDEEAETEGE